MPIISGFPHKGGTGDVTKHNVSPTAHEDIRKLISDVSADALETDNGAENFKRKTPKL